MDEPMRGNITGHQSYLKTELNVDDPTNGIPNLIFIYQT